MDSSSRMNKTLRPVILGLLIASTFTLAACSFKLGDKIRLYGGDETKPAQQSAASRSRAPTPGASASPTAPHCELKSGLTVIESNIPEFESLNEESFEKMSDIAARARAEHISFRLAFIRAVRAYGESNSLTGTELNDFVSKMAQRVPVAFAVPQPPASPTPASPSPAPVTPPPAGIQAWVVYNAALRFATAAHFERDRQLSFATQMSGIESNVVLAFATYEHAYRFASNNDVNIGLGLDQVKAIKFSEDLIKVTDAAKRLVIFEDSYRSALGMGQSREQAQEVAETEACFKPE